MKIPHVASNVFYQLIVKLTTSLVSLLATIVVAVSFGAKGYGVFTQVVTIVSICYLLTDFGINAIHLQQENNEEHFNDLLLLRLLVSLFFTTLLFVVAFILLTFFHLSTLSIGLVLFSLTIPTQALITTTSAKFQKQSRYDKFALGIFVGSLITASCLWVSFYYSSIPLLFLSFFAGGAISAIVCLFLTKEKIDFLNVSKPYIEKLVKKSLPLGIMLLFNLIYFRADIAVLSYFNTQQDVGVYGYAYKYFDFLLTLPLFLSNALYPLMLKEYNEGNKSFLFLKKYLFYAIISAVVVVIFGWMAAPIIALVKNDFTQSILPFRILLLSFPIFVATSFFQWILIAQKKQSQLVGIYILTGILNIVLNIFFVPIFSYNGAALITGVTELAVLITLFGKIFKKGI